MEEQQIQDKNDEHFYWSVGYRDALAGVLSKYNKEIKLKYIAECYQKFTGEKHFSHDWHTT